MIRTKRFAAGLSAATVALAVLCFVPVGYAEGADATAPAVTDTPAAATETADAATGTTDTDKAADAAATTDADKAAEATGTDKPAIGTPEHPVATTNVAQVTTPSGTTTSYTSLADAAAAAPAGSTITLWADLDLPASNIDGTNLSLKLTEGVTLNGNGHKVTVHGRGIYLFGTDDDDNPANYTFRNITITNPDTLGRVVSARDGYKTLRFIDAVLTTTGTGNTQVVTMGGNTPETTEVTFIASTVTASEAGYGIITFNPVHLTLADSQVSGYAALYMKGPDSSAGSSNSRVDINSGSILTGKGIAGIDNSFGTIVLQQCDNVAVNVTDSTVSAEAADGTGADAATHSVVMYSNYGNDNGTAAKDNTVTFGEGSTVNATGANSQLANSNGQSNTVNAEDGTYHIDGKLLGEAPEGTLPQTSLVVTGGNWNKDVAPYAPEGYSEHATGDAAMPYSVGEGSADDNTGDNTDNNPGDNTGTTDPKTDEGTDARANEGTTPNGTDNAATTPATPDDQTDAADNAQGTDAEGGSNNGADDKAPTTHAGVNKNSKTYSSSSYSPYHRTSTRTTGYHPTASIPQTDDSSPLLPFALGAVSMSFVMLVAMFIYRNRANHLR